MTMFYMQLKPQDLIVMSYTSDAGQLYPTQETMTVEEAIKIKNYLNSGSKYKAQLVGKDGVFTDVDVDVVHGKVCAHVFNTQYGNSNSKADAVILDGDFSQELYERFEALRPGGGYLHIIDGGYEVDEYHPKFMEKVNEVIEGTDAA